MPVSHLPQELRHWLTAGDSLTRRLRLRCPEYFHVNLVSQDWERPLPEESAALDLGPGEFALVRQVYLLCGDRRLVFARSIIPRRCLRGHNRRLATLGTRPLADILFARPDVERAEMQVCALTPAATLFRLATKDLVPSPAVLWGRRSLFLLRRKPLLVSEFFLPEIADAPV